MGYYHRVFFTMNIQELFVVAVSLLLMPNVVITENSWEELDISDMVDPSGWNYDRGSKSANTKLSSSEDHVCKELLKVCRKENIAMMTKLSDGANFCSKDENRCEINYGNFKFQKNDNENVNFIKRFINLLLRAAGISRSAMGSSLSTETNIAITVTAEQLEKLERFSSSTGKDVSLREVDAILSDVIQSNNLYIPRDYYSWFDSMSLLLHSKETWFKLGMVGLPLILIWLVLVGHTVARITTVLVVAIFSCSYVITYYRMYKEVEIRQMTILQQNPDVPIKCRPAQMSWPQSLLHSILSIYQFDTDMCQKYQEALLLDPLLEVCPTRVLSAMMADFTLEPAGRIGKAIASFTNGIMGGLPPMYAWFVYIIFVLGLFILLVLALVIACGGRVKVGNFLTRIELSPGNSDPRQITPSASEPPLIQAQIDGSNQHPLVEAFNSSQKGLVLMDTISARELLFVNPTMLQHRQVVEDIHPVKGSNEASDSHMKPCAITGTSMSLNKSANVDSVQIGVSVKDISCGAVASNVAEVDATRKKYYEPTSTTIVGAQDHVNSSKNAVAAIDEAQFIVEGKENGHGALSPIHLSSKGLEICREIRETLRPRGIFTQPVENIPSSGKELDTMEPGEDVKMHINQDYLKCEQEMLSHGENLGPVLRYGSRVQKISNENGSGDTM